MESLRLGVLRSRLSPVMHRVTRSSTRRETARRARRVSRMSSLGGRVPATATREKIVARRMEEAEDQRGWFRKIVRLLVKTTRSASSPARHLSRPVPGADRVQKRLQVACLEHPRRSSAFETLYGFPCPITKRRRQEYLRVSIESSPPPRSRDGADVPQQRDPLYGALFVSKVDPNNASDPPASRAKRALSSVESFAFLP